MIFFWVAIIKADSWHDIVHWIFKIYAVIGCIIAVIIVICILIVFCILGALGKATKEVDRSIQNAPTWKASCGGCGASIPTVYFGQWKCHCGVTNI